MATATPSPVALITAGSAGLGAATARVFAAAGMRVVINYSSNTARATQLLQELRSLSPLQDDSATTNKNFLAIKADLGSRPEIERLVEESVVGMGRLDAVFSNGGWTKVRDFMVLDENMDEADWDRCFNLNVKSHLFLLHAARAQLEANEGAFITTASTAGVKPGGSSLAYSVTKAAQIHLVRGLAVIAAPKIRVNSVSPSLMLTEWGLAFPQEKQDAFLAATKLKRHTTVEDVAEQVLCFARSRSTTGANAILDAGITL